MNFVRKKMPETTFSSLKPGEVFYFSQDSSRAPALKTFTPSNYVYLNGNEGKMTEVNCFANSPVVLLKGAFVEGYKDE